MPTVVGITFKAAGKVYYFDPQDFDLVFGEYAIVETARGTELGQVAIAPKNVAEEEIVQPLKKVLRLATAGDLLTEKENKEKEIKAFELALEKIQEHQLPMKLVDVEYTFDTSKIIFYFTADGRVDFRELVKDLARIFRTRIELRQIGVRDEAKMIGGMGPCGRSLCCQTFLRDFEPVSIKMAKAQELALNPAKISGICGRLMCCLRYECEEYKCSKKVYKTEEDTICNKNEPTVEELLGLAQTKKQNKAKPKAKNKQKQNPSQKPHLAHKKGNPTPVKKTKKNKA